MRSLLKYLRKYRLECVLAPLFKLLEAVFELIVPLVIAYLIDRGIGEGNSSVILKSGGILLLLALLGLAFSITAQYFAAKAATGFSENLRRSLFDYILTLDFETLDDIGTDTLITRMTSDIQRLQTGVNMFLRLFLRSPFIVFGAMIAAFTVDFSMALYFVLLILILFILVALVMSLTGKAYLKAQGALDRITGRTRENLNGVRVIRAFHMEEKEKTGFFTDNEILTSLQKKAGAVSSLMNPVTYVTVNLFTAALIYAGALKVDTGALTRGEVVSLVNYMGQILIELIKLANFIVLLSRAGASGERISDLLKKGKDTRGAGKPFPAEKEGVPLIRFDGVSLSYGSDTDRVLEDISFSVNKGETLGIIGGTGAGKTSLVNLIPGFYKAEEGRVLINGEDVRDIDGKELKDRIGVVFQKARLFRGTVRSNLKWGNENAGDETLYKAIETAQAADFAGKDKKGLDKKIEQGGRNLSGGQKQRLTIARALVKDPEILIFDDASSALDLATDARLREAVRELSGTKTLIIVSQRAASIMYCDRIIVLDDGRIDGAGSHEELLKNSPVYREIYRSQFPEEEAVNG